MASSSLRTRIERIERIVQPPKPPKPIRLVRLHAPAPPVPQRQARAFQAQVAQALRDHDRVILVGDVDEALLALDGSAKLTFVASSLEAVLLELSLRPSTRGRDSALSDMMESWRGNVIEPNPSAAFYGDDEEDEC